MAEPSDPLDRETRPEAGVVESVADGVRRLIAPNPSPMTFTGTATYLIGDESVAVVDPGPLDDGHLEATLEAVGPSGHVEAILVTHSHRDHSAGARRLSRLTGAPIRAFGRHGAGMSDRMRALSEAGLALGGGEGADESFEPDARLGDGDTVEGRGWRLTALHTPGHLSNHLCFALEGAGVVFTGDHVMAWATTLVSPPEGDMTAFLASLRRLRAREDLLFLPGHGGPVRAPARMIDWQIKHRETRERQILAALGDGPADAESLARRIYADLDPALLPAARRNVLAHLLALVEEGGAAPCGVLSERASFALSPG